MAVLVTAIHVFVRVAVSRGWPGRVTMPRLLRALEVKAE
jgi:hypothetical protein